MSKNLIEDLDDPLKRADKISDSIKNLEHKTLSDTMKLINNFLFNDN